MKNKINGSCNLPTTRFQLYFDVIKQNWRKLILSGLLLTLFFLPTLVTLFFRDYFVIYASLQAENAEEFQSLTVGGLSAIYGVFCASLLIASVGISGLSKVWMHLSYEEGFFFFGDFKLGIKQNIKTCIFATLIYIVLLYMTLFINISTTNDFLGHIPLGICQGIAFPILLIIFASNTIYDWKFKDSIRNGALIYIKYFFFILLFSLLLFAVNLLLLIPNIILRYAVVLLYFILIQPFIAFAFVVYMNHCFDEGINKANYPKLYRKGLFKSKQEITLDEIDKIINN